MTELLRLADFRTTEENQAIDDLLNAPKLPIITPKRPKWRRKAPRTPMKDTPPVKVIAMYALPIK